MIEQQVMIEKDLIYQAKSGNENAYGVLYQHHLDAIYTYISKRVTGVSEVEDLAQIVFLKAWQALQNYQPTTVPFRAWLYRIAHNTVVDYYRAQKETVQWEDMSTVGDSANTPEGVLLEIERRETVRNALATLRPSYRDVITHRFINDKDYAETAKALNRKVNGVRVLQHRALDALRRTLVRQSALWIALVATAAALVFGTTIVQAATRALPGERLYPLRTFVEETRLAMSNDATDIRLHTEFANQRVADLQTLSQQGRVEAIDETVTKFSSHIHTASVKLTALSQTNADAPALTAQFDQSLQEQAASLAALESTTSSTMKSIIQPAFEAVIDAQQGLDGQNNPSTPNPSIINPSTGEQSESRLPAREQHVIAPATKILMAMPTPLPSPKSRLPGNPMTADDTRAAHIRPEAVTPVTAGLSTEIASDANHSPAQRGNNVGESLQSTVVNEVTPNHAPADLPANPPIEPQPTLDSPSDAGQPQNPNAPSHTALEQPSSAPEEQPDTAPLPGTSSPEAPPTDTPPVEDQDSAANTPAASEESHQEQEQTSPAPSTNADGSSDSVDDKPHTETPSDQPNAGPATKDK